MNQLTRPLIVIFVLVVSFSTAYSQSPVEEFSFQIKDFKMDHQTQTNNLNISISYRYIANIQKADYPDFRWLAKDVESLLANYPNKDDYWEIVNKQITSVLLNKYPGIVAGVKDSSGDWSNTKAMLDNFAKGGFDVFAGSEVFLLDNMRNGGKGCITATGNVNAGPIANVYKNWRSADADNLQAGITATRKIVQKQPMIPALKAAVAHFGNDPQWKTCRPPLTELSAAEETTLISELKASGFTMPGLAG